MDAAAATLVDCANPTYRGEKFQLRLRRCGLIALPDFTKSGFGGKKYEKPFRPRSKGYRMEAKSKEGKKGSKGKQW